MLQPTTTKNSKTKGSKNLQVGVVKMQQNTSQKNNPNKIILTQLPQFQEDANLTFNKAAEILRLYYAELAEPLIDQLLASNPIKTINQHSTNNTISYYGFAISPLSEQQRDIEVYIKTFTQGANFLRLRIKNVARFYVRLIILMQLFRLLGTTSSDALHNKPIYTDIQMYIESLLKNTISTSKVLNIFDANKEVDFDNKVKIVTPVLEEFIHKLNLQMKTSYKLYKVLLQKFSLIFSLDSSENKIYLTQGSLQCKFYATKFINNANNRYLDIHYFFLLLLYEIDGENTPFFINNNLKRPLLNPIQNKQYNVYMSELKESFYLLGYIYYKKQINIEYHAYVRFLPLSSNLVNKKLSRFFTDKVTSQDPTSSMSKNTFSLLLTYLNSVTELTQLELVKIFGVTPSDNPNYKPFSPPPSKNV